MWEAPVRMKKYTNVEVTVLRTGEYCPTSRTGLNIIPPGKQQHGQREKHMNFQEPFIFKLISADTDAALNLPTFIAYQYCTK